MNKTFQRRSRGNLMIILVLKAVAKQLSFIAERFVSVVRSHKQCAKVESGWIVL